MALCPQVQIDPYLEDSMCQICIRQPGPFFCREQVSVPTLTCLQHVVGGLSEQNCLSCL